MISNRLGRALVAAFALVVGGAAVAAGVDDRMLNDTADGRNWPAFGRTQDESHYSPLTQIDDGNVSRLGLAWTLDLDVPFANSVPLAVDGVLYVAAGQSVVHAIDARTGRLLWRYDPKVGEVAGKKMRPAWGVRGLAMYGTRVFVGTMDGRLLAIDAKKGTLDWSVMTVDPNDGRFISGPPRVFNGKVVIGHGGADSSPARGYVTAYDTDTGRQLWRFYTVPGNPADGFENKAMEMAARTWTGQWWKFGGGGTAWHAITYDPEFNRVYIGTGNGAPWNQKIRSPGGGDNLFLCSIIALDADTGEYAWHYQTNPAETWDFNSAMEIQLATLTIDGKPTKVILHAPKNGFFYVIDRSTGKPISAEKFAKVTWAEKIDLATGRPVELPNMRYMDGGPLIMYPGPHGAHNWYAMAFSPKTGLVYLPTSDMPGFYMDKGLDLANWSYETAPNPLGVVLPNADTPRDLGTSRLQAWDPIAQRAVWTVETPGTEAGAALATGGNLVFQGQLDGNFNAYAADTGKRLWTYYANNGLLTTPITYSAGGKQYVTVLAAPPSGGAAALGTAIAQFGWDARLHPRRVMTFVLDGKGKLPPTPPPRVLQAIEDPQFVPDESVVAAGSEIFGSKCIVCHGPAAVSAGTVPDLRASPVILAPETFAQIVQGGASVNRGMPQFGELGTADLAAIRHYLRARALETRRAAQSAAAH
ncbi:MAG: PQQ-dependent dehydrogenase, methanol/ethanol family [Gammaproteobacteria bacterium]